MSGCDWFLMEAETPDQFGISDYAGSFNMGPIYIVGVTPEDLRDALYTKASVVYCEASGNPASFSDCLGGPVKSCVANIELFQSGSGDPTPTNNRPIAGYTGTHFYISPTQDAQDATEYSFSWQAQVGAIALGALNVLTGILTVYAFRYKAKDLAWERAVSGDYRYRFNIPNEQIYGADMATRDIWCSCLTTTRDFPGTTSTKISVNARGQLLANAYGVTTVDALIQMFEDNDADIAWRLATPQTYQLTPADVVTSLLGQNYAWSDTGGASVLYPCDTENYVTRRLAAQQRLLELIITANRETTMTATQNYTSGDLIIAAGSLYKATANIASGSTLAIGTNILATTIAAELAALA